MTTTRSIPSGVSAISVLRWNKLRSWLKWSVWANLLVSVVSAALFWLNATHERSTLGAGILFALALVAFVGFTIPAYLLWLFRMLARREPVPRIGCMIAAMVVVILEFMAAALIVWPFQLLFLKELADLHSKNSLLFDLTCLINTLLLILLSASLLLTCLAFARWVWTGRTPNSPQAFPVEIPAKKQHP